MKGTIIAIASFFLLAFVLTTVVKCDAKNTKIKRIEYVRHNNIKIDTKKNIPFVVYRLPSNSEVFSVEEKCYQGCSTWIKFKHDGICYFLKDSYRSGALTDIPCKEN